MFDAEVSKMQALRHTNAVVRMSAAPGSTRTRGGGTRGGGTRAAAAPVVLHT